MWAWEHNDPTTEFHSLPPFVVDMQGNASVLAQPESKVVDLDGEGLLPGDVHELVRDLGSARLKRRVNGSLRIVKILGQNTDGQSVEVDHPIVDVINLRRAKAGKPPLEKGE